MRFFAVVALAALAGCAAGARGPAVPVPPAEPGRVSLVARAVDRVGAVQPIAVVITNGEDRSLRLDARQVYALTAEGARFPSLPPAEAARQAGGRRLPGAVRGGVVGAATGSVLGAIGGAISGAIQGGIGAAVGVGSAVGAAVGAVGGVLGATGPPAPDVAGFTDRALPSTLLEQGLSASGYIYFPPGTHVRVEVLLLTDTGGPERVEAPIEPAS